MPGFSMTLLEQSLLYNRRRNDSEVVVTGIDNHVDYIGQHDLIKPFSHSCFIINYEIKIYSNNI